MQRRRNTRRDGALVRRRGQQPSLEAKLRPYGEAAVAAATPLVVGARDSAAPVAAQLRDSARPLLAQVRDTTGPLAAKARKSAQPYADELRASAAPVATQLRANGESLATRLRADAVPLAARVAGAAGPAVERVREQAGPAFEQLGSRAEVVAARIGRELPVATAATSAAATQAAVSAEQGWELGRARGGAAWSALRGEPVTTPPRRWPWAVLATVGGAAAGAGVAYTLRNRDRRADGDPEVVAVIDRPVDDLARPAPATGGDAVAEGVHATPPADEDAHA